MKKILILLAAVLLLLVGTAPVLGQIYGQGQGAQYWNFLETQDQARQRHEAERQEIYQRQGNRAPLGGYPERLGDPAPPGTLRPGFTDPYGEPDYRPPYGRYR